MGVSTVGNGTVAKSPDQPTYAYGDSVSLTANADPGWHFTGWSGDLGGSVNPESILMNSSKSVTATFEADAYTLGVSTVGNGTVAKSPDQPTYAYGDSVSLTANADPGWHFTGWSGDLGGSVNPESILMNSSKSVTATFEADAYTLGVSTVGNGTVAKSPDQPTYAYGDSVSLTASADPGWHFTGWSGDLGGSVNPESILMNSSKSVTATFEADAYTLGVSTIGNGTVAKSPDQPTYAYGDSVSLTASADPGWHFTGWSGDLGGSVNPESILMNSSKSVTATFEADAYTLGVSTVGNGTVAKSPDQPTYAYGDSVSLTANADPGWHFTGWSGDLGGSVNPESILMNSSKSVTATFEADAYTLGVSTVGNGTVAKSPDQPTYAYGDSVSLTANADPGWHFTGWSGDLGGSVNPESILMNSSKSVTATFEADAYTLGVSTVGNGTVAKSPDQPTYAYGDSVGLTANADPGWHFTGWSGDLGGSVNPESILMNSSKSVTATFEADAYTLGVSTVGNGTVAKSPDQPTYAYGDSVSLTANADPGWHFTGWSGDLGGSVNPESILMNSSKSVTATFEADAYTLGVSTVGNGTVAKSPDQPTYAYGDSVSLTANADPGWHFTGWSGDLGGSVNPESILMTILRFF